LEPAERIRVEAVCDHVAFDDDQSAANDPPRAAAPGISVFEPNEGIAFHFAPKSVIQSAGENGGSEEDSPKPRRDPTAPLGPALPDQKSRQNHGSKRRN